jgi:hypothetical protein
VQGGINLGARHFAAVLNVTRQVANPLTRNAPGNHTAMRRIPTRSRSRTPKSRRNSQKNPRFASRWASVLTSPSSEGKMEEPVSPRLRLTPFVRERTPPTLIPSVDRELAEPSVAQRRASFLPGNASLTHPHVQGT